MENDSSHAPSVLNRIKNNFLTGLLLFIPIFITLYILSFILGLLGNLNDLLPNFVLEILKVYLGLSDAVITTILFILFLCFITFLGSLSTIYFGRKFIDLFSYLLERLPFVGGIYRATNNLLSTLFSGGESFKGVCLIRYPNDSSSYTIAFITGKAPDPIQAKFNHPMINCFVPTTPNPTSGFFLLVPESEVIFLDIGIDEGLGLLLSLGTSSKAKKG